MRINTYFSDFTMNELMSCRLVRYSTAVAECTLRQSPSVASNGSVCSRSVAPLARAKCEKKVAARASAAVRSGVFGDATVGGADGCIIDRPISIIRSLLDFVTRNRPRRLLLRRRPGGGQSAGSLRSISNVRASSTGTAYKGRYIFPLSFIAEL
jgi:hypothetical protein